jgi:hypothetical protein
MQGTIRICFNLIGDGSRKLCISSASLGNAFGKGTHCFYTAAVKMAMFLPANTSGRDLNRDLIRAYMTRMRYWEQKKPGGQAHWQYSRAVKIIKKVQGRIRKHGAMFVHLPSEISTVAITQETQGILDGAKPLIPENMEEFDFGEDFDDDDLEDVAESKEKAEVREYMTGTRTCRPRSGPWGILKIFQQRQKLGKRFEVSPYRTFTRCILAIFQKYTIFAQF